MALPNISLKVLKLVYTSEEQIDEDPSKMTPEQLQQYIVDLEQAHRLRSRQLNRIQSEIQKLVGFRFNSSDFSRYDQQFAYLKEVLKVIGFDVSNCRKAYQLLRLIDDHNLMVQLRLCEFCNNNPKIQRTSTERRRLIADFGVELPRPLVKMCVDRTQTFDAAFGIYLELCCDINLPSTLYFYNYRRLATEYLKTLPLCVTSESDRVFIETGLKRCFYIIPECLVKEIAMRSIDLQSGLVIMNDLRSFIEERV
jgi:hypothetical protein